MFKNHYVQERDFEKRSQIRLRGKLWFQIFVFLIHTAFAFAVALLLGTLSKVIWYFLTSTIGNFVTNMFMGVDQFKPFSLDYLQFLTLQSITGQDLAFNQSWVVTLLMVGSFAFIEFYGIKRWWDWVQLYSDRSLSQTRWTTLRELDRTYKLIPDRNKYYLGKSGAPIAHISGFSLRFAQLHPFLWIRQLIKLPFGLTNELFPQWYANQVRPRLIDWFPKLFEKQLNVKGGYKGFYWIDPDATHDDVLGATRMGKDQRLGYPRIDILRRAEIQDTLIDTDAKNEDAKMSYVPLREAGYEVQLLNIQDVDWSESWNPFQTALDYAIDGEWDKARDEAAVVVQIIGSSNANPQQAHGDVWDSSAKDTQLAIILILLWLAIKHDNPALATPASVPQFINSMSAFNDPEDKNADGLTQYFNLLRHLDPMPPIINEALLKAGSYLGATGDTKTSIMFTLQNRISLFVSETVARLTSQSTLNVADYGFPRIIKGRLDPMYAGSTLLVELIDSSTNKVIEQDKLKVSRSGVIQYPFHNAFPDAWAIKFTFNEEHNKKKFRNDWIKITGVRRIRKRINGQPLIDKYTQRPIYYIRPEKKETRLQERTSFSYDLRYTDKPLAVFVITPQDNDNYAELASLFLGQVFSTNTAIASNITRRKMDRRIIYKLNEFSMFPRIPGFDNFLTRGLTYGHVVDIYLQDQTQLTKHYSEQEAQEIANQMLTQFYVMTKDAKGNKELSESLGEIEVQKENANFQSGSDRQNKGNIQATVERRALLTPKEVSELMDGEMIITRSAKRNDKRFRKIRPLPIFDTGDTIMPNARDLLGKSFKLDYYTTDLNIQNKNKHLSYDDLFLDFRPYFELLANEVDMLDLEQGRELDENTMPGMVSVNDAPSTIGSPNSLTQETPEQPSGESLLNTDDSEEAAWRQMFRSDLDAPFLSETELADSLLMANVESLIADFITKVYYMRRTSEQTNALRLAKHGKLFKHYPDWNTRRMVYNLLSQNIDDVWQVEKRKRSYLATGVFVTETDGEPTEEAGNESVIEEEDAKTAFLQNLDQPFLNDDELSNPDLEFNFEAELADIIVNHGSSVRTKEVEEAIQWAEQGELFNEHPEYNNRRTILRLLSNDADLVWQLEQFRLAKQQEFN